MPKNPGKTRKYLWDFPHSGYFRVLPALDAGDRRGSLPGLPYCCSAGLTLATVETTVTHATRPPPVRETLRPPARRYPHSRDSRRTYWQQLTSRRGVVLLLASAGCLTVPVRKGSVARSAAAATATSPRVPSATSAPAATAAWLLAPPLLLAPTVASLSLAIASAPVPNRAAPTTPIKSVVGRVALPATAASATSASSSPSTTVPQRDAARSAVGGVPRVLLVLDPHPLLAHPQPNLVRELEVALLPRSLAVRHHPLDVAGR
mmetsp:Transcript_26939/g.86559  ORF Transcript_26939/g.86559 Transcript_26939/m.86559 type:complete len:262 (+) Transcript_26939:892-1677(+)